MQNHVLQPPVISFAQFHETWCLTLGILAPNVACKYPNSHRLVTWASTNTTAARKAQNRTWNSNRWPGKSAAEREFASTHTQCDYNNITVDMYLSAIWERNIFSSRSFLGPNWRRTLRPKRLKYCTQKIKNSPGTDDSHMKQLGTWCSAASEQTRHCKYHPNIIRHQFLSGIIGVYLYRRHKSYTVTWSSGNSSQQASCVCLDLGMSDEIWYAQS